MSEPARLVTAEELEKFPDDDFRYELVEGRVLRMTPVGYVHGRIVMRFGSLLEQHVRSQRLGVVLTEVGVKLKSVPDTVRAPDLAFIRRERIPASAVWERRTRDRSSRARAD
jgi:Uma2 family endonuclease